MKKTYEIIEIDLEEDLIDKLTIYALDKIKNDRQALIEYGVNDIFTYIVENEEEFKKMVEKDKKETDSSLVENIKKE